MYTNVSICHRYMGRTVSENRKIKVHSAMVADGPGSEGVFTYASVLPLGMLISYSKSHKNGLLCRTFDFQQLVNRGEKDFCRLVDTQSIDPQGPSVWLFSSYVWNHASNMELSRYVRVRLPKSIIIVGGPHIPAYQDEAKAFFEKEKQVDIAVRGQGEITLAETLEIIAAHTDIYTNLKLETVPGITFRTNNGIIRTTDRSRNMNLGILPSPYLTGEFDDPSFNSMEGMMLETNRGCPFGCTFCDWGSATLQKFSLFDLDRVKNEIDFIASKKARAIYLTDSNFGAFERDVEIAQYIADTKRKYGFPESFGSSFAKNASEKLVRITRILHEAKLKSAGMISIQSTDQAVLKTIERSNIKQEKHEKLIGIFKKEKIFLSSELMIGLPGQTVDSHKNDLQYFFDRKIVTTAFCTQIMPNAPMNEPSYREKDKIVTDVDGFVVSASTFSESDYRFMIKIFLSYQFFYGLGALKYFLYYLQMEHTIKAMDFIKSLLLVSEANPDTYPLNFSLQNKLLKSMDTRMKGLPTLHWNTTDSAFIFNQLDAYYKEIVKFTFQQYGVEIPHGDLATLLVVQKAVMPVIGKKVPLEVQMEHDFVRYFDQIKQTDVVSLPPAGFRPLSSFSPGSLLVRARVAKTIDHLNLARVDLQTAAGWELKSGLKF